MLTSSIIQLLGWIAAFVCAFLLGNVFRPFFNSYAAKKGENLATKEDIAQLTKIAEGIRAEISDKVWDRQKQWEMRRDVVFEVLRSLGQYDNALLELCVAYSTSIEDVDSAMTSRLEKGGNWNRIGANLDGTGFLVVAICGDTLYKALSAYLKGTRAVANDILNGKPERYTASQGDRANQIKALRAAVRKELNME
jgi:hypothetical protein